MVYAASPVRSESDGVTVEDLLDVFFSEHEIPLKGVAGNRWMARRQAIEGAIFPRVTPESVLRLLRERRFVVLEGPPGTGKTRLALEVAKEIGDPTLLQFHAARTYEDFVVGLFPTPSENGIRFEPERIGASNRGRPFLSEESPFRSGTARVSGPEASQVKASRTRYRPSSGRRRPAAS